MITIKAFAQIKELIGMVNQLELEEERISISEFKSRISQLFPSIQSVIDNCRFSNDTMIYSSDSIIENGSVVYIIPPSSGG
jgi:molybdopterin converting factor small subunit